MVGKMCAARNRFFTRRYKGAKNKDLLFLRFYNCEPFEEGPGANRRCHKCLPPQYSPSGILRLLLSVMYIPCVKFYKVLLEAKTCSLIHC